MKVRATRLGWSVVELCHVCGGDGSHLADIEPNRLTVAGCVCEDGWLVVSSHRSLAGALRSLARHRSK